MLDRLTPNIKPFAWDDVLIESVTTKNLSKFSCYPFLQTAIVAGYGSNLSKEIRLEKLFMDHIPIYRRQGGGCSVFLDQGCLIVSIAFPAKGFSGIPALFNRCTRWLLRGLTKTGINGVYQDGISDLVIDNHKIGGSCLKRSKGLAYFSSCLLVSSDLDRMEYYLKHPPREPAYRNGRRHNDFVRNINQYHHEVTIQDLAPGLEKNLALGFS
jgi:lipoate---protein ligase